MALESGAGHISPDPKPGRYSERGDAAQTS